MAMNMQQAQVCARVVHAEISLKGARIPRLVLVHTDVVVQPVGAFCVKLMLNLQRVVLGNGKIGRCPPT